MSSSRAVTAGLAVLILIAGAAGFRVLSSGRADVAAEPRAMPPGPVIEVAVASRPDAPPSIRQTGFLTAAQDVSVAFEVGGRIAGIDPSFEVGRRVASGDAIARLDPNRLDAALRRAEADLRAATARADETRQRFDRVQTLVDRDVASEAEIDAARAARDTAQAQVAVAEAALEQARIDRDAATVTAPFDAVVTARSASPGQMVSAGQPVGQLVRADRARITLGLADRQARALGALSALKGETVTIRRAGGDGPVLRQGTISEVDPRIDPAARTTNLVIDVERPFADPPLRLGQLLSVAVAVPDVGALIAVPDAAVKDGGTVWLVDDDTLRERQVDVVLRSGGRAYLSDADGLEGRRLMTTDLAGTRDGMAVRVAEDDGAGAGGTAPDAQSGTQDDASDTHGAGSDTQDAASGGAGSDAVGSDGQSGTRGGQTATGQGSRSAAGSDTPDAPEAATTTRTATATDTAATAAESGDTQ